MVTVLLFCLDEVKRTILPFRGRLLEHAKEFKVLLNWELKTIEKKLHSMNPTFQPNNWEWSKKHKLFTMCFFKNNSKITMPKTFKEMIIQYY